MGNAYRCGRLLCLLSVRARVTLDGLSATEGVKVGRFDHRDLGHDFLQFLGKVLFKLKRGLFDHDPHILIGEVLVRHSRPAAAPELGWLRRCHPLVSK